MSPNPPCKLGHVTLVGAGPGDPELLTLRAARILGTADLVMHDALVSTAILAMVRPGARLIDVGKRCGRHPMSQAAINRLIVREARAGRHVVRLKGGDPFVFGRGGEEIECLRQAGVGVDVIPGVTAACAAAASLQVPLTHRGVSRSLHLISGHAADGTIPIADWLVAARSGGTIAAYMASRCLGDLTATLMKAGLPGSTPAVAVESATRPDERHAVGTLGTLAALLSGRPPEGPLVVLIGEVTSLALGASQPWAFAA